MTQTEYETYQYTSEKNGRGMYFHTDCGNWMYSVKTDVMAYHGCLCPRCLSNGKYTTLYLRGTPEANRIIDAGMAAILEVITINHDYTHCLDYKKDLCPKTCFRAQLSEDLAKNPHRYLSWSNLKGSALCPLAKDTGADEKNN